MDGCWDGLCGSGLVDCMLTVTVREGDMCSSSNHELLLGTGWAYVAPSVGFIHASASPREICRGRQRRRYSVAFNTMVTVTDIFTAASPALP